jgi:hypothetical protein
MRKFVSSLTLSVLFAGGLLAQSASDPNPRLTISHDSLLNEFSLSWWGIDEFYYFVLATEDLVGEPWVYFPYAVKGNDEVKGPPPFETNASKMFFRLEYSADTKSELLSADYNGAGISAWKQMELGFNPFEWVDVSANSIHDAWELYHFGAIGVDPHADPEGDGASNLGEYLAGTNPTHPDHPSVGLVVFTSLNRSE